MTEVALQSLAARHFQLVGIKAELMQEGLRVARNLLPGLFTGSEPPAPDTERVKLLAALDRIEAMLDAPTPKGPCPPGVRDIVTVPARVAALVVPGFPARPFKVWREAPDLLGCNGMSMLGGGFQVRASALRVAVQAVRRSLLDAGPQATPPLVTGPRDAARARLRWHLSPPGPSTPLPARALVEALSEKARGFLGSLEYLPLAEERAAADLRYHLRKPSPGLLQKALWLIAGVSPAREGQGALVSELQAALGWRETDRAARRPLNDPGDITAAPKLRPARSGDR